MSFKETFHDLVKDDDQVKVNTIDIIGDLISALLGDPVSAAKVMKKIYETPLMIREKLFWVKFEKFLDGIYDDPQNIQKMSEVFADHENDKNYAARIIKIIEDLNTVNKTIYIINLTRACLQGFIDKNMYFRLCSLIVNTLEEDLYFIKLNISTDVFEEDINILSLMYNGLMFETKDGYTFTKIAHFLDVYSLSYGDENKYSLSNYNVPEIPKPISQFQLQYEIIGDDIKYLK